MYENMNYYAGGTIIMGAIPHMERRIKSRARRKKKNAIDLGKAGAVFSCVTLLCIAKWLTVVLGTEIGSGIGPEEIVLLIAALISFAASAICMIWKKRS